MLREFSKILSSGRCSTWENAAAWPATALPALGIEADDPRRFLERPACQGSRKPSARHFLSGHCSQPGRCRETLSPSPPSWRRPGWASGANRSRPAARGTGLSSTDHRRPSRVREVARGVRAGQRACWRGWRRAACADGSGRPGRGARRSLARRLKHVVERVSEALLPGRLSPTTIE